MLDEKKGQVVEEDDEFLTDGAVVLCSTGIASHMAADNNM